MLKLLVCLILLPLIGIAIVLGALLGIPLALVSGGGVAVGALGALLFGGIALAVFGLVGGVFATLLTVIASVLGAVISVLWAVFSTLLPLLLVLAALLFAVLLVPLALPLLLLAGIAVLATRASRRSTTPPALLPGAGLVA